MVPFPSTKQFLAAWGKSKQNSWLNSNHYTFTVIFKYLNPAYLNTMEWSRARKENNVDLCLWPGLCGCTAGTRDRPCPQRRLYTSPGAGPLSGAASGLPSGTSAGSRWEGTQSLCKWVSAWCTRRTAGPGFHGEASWFKQKEKEVKYEGVGFFSQLYKPHFSVGHMCFMSLTHKIISIFFNCS